RFVAARESQDRKRGHGQTETNLTRTDRHRTISLAGRRIVVGAAEHDVDDLLFGIAQELADAFLAADAGILEAPIGHAAIVLADAVDPDVTGLNGLRDLERAIDVVGPNGRRETEL